MSETATAPGVSLVKGQNIPLTKDNPGLKNLNIGLGWDVNQGNGKDFDLDAFALPVNAAGKIENPHNIVYFGNLTSAGIKHSGDNLTGQGDGDDETIFLDLAAIPASVDKVLLCVNIYEAGSRSQNFGMVKNAFIRAYDGDSKQELGRYDLSEDYSANTGVVMGEVYRHQGEWKFKAIGEGKNGDINQIAAPYRA